MRELKGDEFEAQVRACENYDHALVGPDGERSIAALEANS
jgi:hypothetical protein